MDFDWVAIALGDVVWISIAFALGFLSRLVGLPPLVGFLATGFLLSAQGIVSGEVLQKLSDLGITLLLFTIGLKLNMPSLARPQVWAVSMLHALIVVVCLGLAAYGLASTGLPLLTSLDLPSALLLAFALSFSSTVFVAKVLEERSEMASLHGRIAIGVLIVQDLAAVVFLAFSADQPPSLWALAAILLIPLRPLLHALLERVGHGELLVLYGFLLALGGAELFEIVGLKGDLGALALGILVANHAKSEELAKTMLGFKDLFLLGFFLSIGLSGEVTVQAAVAAILLTPLILLKSALFFALFAAFRLRARTSLLASLKLSNFSEFGLIVAAVGVANEWIDSQWLIVIAIALSLSFVVAASLNTMANEIYNGYRDRWRLLQRRVRLPDDRPIDIQDASIAIIGMGGIGTGAYERMRELHGDTVVGVDSDPITVARHAEYGRRVVRGDPGDADFWDRVRAGHSLNLVMLTLPQQATSLAVMEQLRMAGFEGYVAAIAKFPDEIQALREAGVDTVFNVYSEAGAGFASHVDAASR